MAQKTVEAAGLLKDVAEGFREVVQEIPDPTIIPDQQWDHVLEAWRAPCVAANEMRGGLQFSERFFASATAASVTTSTAVTSFSTFHLSKYDLSPAFRSATQRLDVVLQRGPLLSDVRAALLQLGLDHPGGTIKSPIELLEDARLALDRPGGDEPSALNAWVGLREAIDLTLSRLLPRRPMQEQAPTHQGKVASLGVQCGKDNLPPGHFDRLGKDLHQLMNTLSSAKQRKLDRGQVTHIFNQGLLFLKAFLGSLDPAKLNP